MSVRVMSMVFQAKLKNLTYIVKAKQRQAKASTCKLLLLAYADHANDDGISAYPSYTLLEVKTGLSRQGIADTLEALRTNALLIPDGVSARKTNQYRINLDKLADLTKQAKDQSSHLTSETDDESSHLTSTSQATLPTLVKPLDSNHHKPSIKPSVKKDSSPNGDTPSQKSSDLFLLAQALSDVCFMDLAANRGRLFREAKLLAGATNPPATAELILAHYNGDASAFWKAQDWRGKKGQRPTPSAIRETWGQWGVSPAPALETEEQVHAEYLRMNPRKARAQEACQ